jgi:hypothetical protein
MQWGCMVYNMAALEAQNDEIIKYPNKLIQNYCMDNRL